MENREYFITFWKNLKEDMASALDYQIELHGRLDAASVQQIYSDKLLRWDTRMSPEGQWLLSMKDEKADEAKRRILNLKLAPVKSPSKKSSDNLLIYGAVGAVAGYVVGMIAPVPFGQVIFAVIGAGAGATASGKKNNAQQKKELAFVKNEYMKQIIQHGEEIAQIWG